MGVVRTTYGPDQIRAWDSNPLSRLLVPSVRTLDLTHSHLKVQNMFYAMQKLGTSCSFKQFNFCVFEDRH